MTNVDQGNALADELKNLMVTTPRRHGGHIMRCDEILDTLTGEDRAMFDEVIRTPTVSCERIASTMRARGVVIASTSVRAWRRANGVSE